MIQKQLNFSNGRKGIFVKQGVTGEMLYGSNLEKRGGSVQAEKSTLIQKRIEKYLNNELTFAEISNKIGKSRTLIHYYFKKILKEKGKSGDVWGDKIKEQNKRKNYVKRANN